MAGRPDRRSQRSRAGDLAQKVYTSKRWRALRWEVWHRDAGKCAACGQLIIGTFHVDHIKPHKNDLALIWDKNNLHLMHPVCHNSGKQSEEKRGYSKAVGPDGWPIDTANHPFYK
jgi:5-methylcytosine-specific restriction endonuclease McrA